MTNRPYIREFVKPRRFDDERHDPYCSDDQKNEQLPVDWRSRLPLLSDVFARRGIAIGKANDRGWSHCACPWCGQRELGVHDASGRWRCRGCEKRGDAVSLVMSLDEATFPAAVRTLMAYSIFTHSANAVGPF